MFLGIPTRKDWLELSSRMGPAEDAYNRLANSWDTVAHMPLETLREFINVAAVLAGCEAEAAELYRKAAEYGDEYDMRRAHQNTMEFLDAARDQLSVLLSAPPPPPPPPPAPAPMYAPPPGPAYGHPDPACAQQQYPPGGYPQQGYVQPPSPPAAPPPPPPPSATDDPDDDWN